MQARAVLDEERIGHESQHGIGAAEFGQTALLGRVIDRCETSCRPSRGGRGRRREFVDERLGVACRARIAWCAEHQGRHCTCQ